MKTKQQSEQKQRTSVAVIGCGPSGMFFLHALAQQRKKYEEEGDVDSLAKLPIVTVFERSSEPGGVWRSEGMSGMEEEASKSSTVVSSLLDLDIAEDRGGNSDDESSDNSKSDEGSIASNSSNISAMSSDSEEDPDYIVEDNLDSKTSMYEALWTNAPSQVIEFSDYTFDEHFKGPLPIYLPRSAVLEYMMARVTRNNPTIFDSVQFNTSVEYVKYDEAKKKFKIITEDAIKSVKKQTHLFDKCVWAAGLNGFPKIPRTIRKTLKSGSFSGIEVHSSQAANYLPDLKGERIVLIGDGLSAEDLALEAIKLGVDKIYVIARSGDGVCSDTSAWPGDKVKVIHDRVVSEVIQKGKGLRLKARPKEEDVESLDLNDISAVIYCTGYEENQDMLGSSVYIEEEQYSFSDLLPENWEMEPNHLTDYVGSVKPSKVLNLCNDLFTINANYYKGVSVHNPNMMFLHEESDYPLKQIDVRAWYLLGIITGDLELPSRLEMKKEMSNLLQKSMQVTSARMLIDKEYKEKIALIYPDLSQKERIKQEEVYARLSIDILADEINMAKYPQSLKTSDKLNEDGELLVKMLVLYGAARETMIKSDWKTFRDIDPTGFKSIITGTPAVPLKKRWLDIDDTDPDILQLS